MYLTVTTSAVFDVISKAFKSKGLYFIVCLCDKIEQPLGMLALRKCQPCFALDFKGVGNKMAMDDGIS